MHRRVTPTVAWTGARAAAVALLVLLGACQTEDSGLPTAPRIPVAVGPASTTTTIVPSTPVGFPELTGPGRVYSLVSEDASDWDYGTGGPLTSRYVLYDDGEFALQYAEIDFQAEGTYTDTDGFIELTWDPERHWQSWEPWEATATLAGDTLTVDYPVHMWLVGFLDAVYVRTE